MSTGIQPRDEVLPGYVLTERIGSGGYAEVWRAEAPGGIDKAVKIVYGYHDDEFATQELKALERIKGVRHPFLLSLERFEIVDGRLAILTELADMSLEQRLRACRADGLSGIPRAELLLYMADAAEALDFLTLKHGLQHLDVKPENLLVLGDHLKVADFGLVKELTTKSQNSLVAGLTPTYASPEMFDDSPSEQSDQYSLAIVYQEMLVGVLPFPGRTAAQLAKQHMQAEPQMQALPAHDRPIVARALAKNPTERYPSCRAFVDALLHADQPARAPKYDEADGGKRSATKAPVEPSLDDTQRASVSTTQPRRALQTGPDVTQSMQRGDAASIFGMSSSPNAEPEPPVQEEIDDVPVPEFDADLQSVEPTLFIAVGGVGIQVMCRLRDLLAEDQSQDETMTGVETIAIDTDRNELRAACSPQWKHPLCSDDTLHLPLRLPKSYDDSRDILNWVSRRWLYNIPRSLETRGYRPLGRVALVDHTRNVLLLLDQRLKLLVAASSEPSENGDSSKAKLRVVVLCGTGGGTGAGMAVDVANAARQLALSHGAQVKVDGFFLFTCFGTANSSTLAAANTYALLTELRHASEHGNLGLLSEQRGNHAFESDQPPFDHVYCIPVRSGEAGSQPSDAINTVAKYLALETTQAAAVIRACRQSQTPKEESLAPRLSLRKLGLVAFSELRQDVLHTLAAELAASVTRRWLSKDESRDLASLAGQGRQLTDEVEDSAGSKEKENAADQSGAVNVRSFTPEKVLAEFKDHASSRFATAVLAYVERHSNSRESRGRSLFSRRETATFIDSAIQTLEALAADVALESDAAHYFEDRSGLAGLVADTSERILARVMTCLDPTELDQDRRADVVHDLIVGECVELLSQYALAGDWKDSVEALLHSDDEVSKAIRRASSDLFQCGYDRRTLLIVPAETADGIDAEKLLAERPTAATTRANVRHAVLLCEESGISPRSIGRGLARVYPGIADAAHRLFTRTDVDWQNLV